MFVDKSLVQVLDKGPARDDYDRHINIISKIHEYTTLLCRKKIIIIKNKFYWRTFLGRMAVFVHLNWLVNFSLKKEKRMVKGSFANLTSDRRRKIDDFILQQLPIQFKDCVDWKVLFSYIGQCVCDTEPICLLIELGFFSST